jgi:hypothetical protein
MRFFILSFIIIPFLSLSAFEAPLLPVHQVEAEKVDYGSNKLVLVGNVKVIHDLGIIHCQEATLLFSGEKKEGDALFADRILLHNDVSIDFSSGSKLTSDEADIDCKTLEASFASHSPHRVVYITHAVEEGVEIPVKATSKTLKAKIIKTSSGYSLSNLQGEGAVSIEYLRNGRQGKEDREGEKK